MRFWTYWYGTSTTLFLHTHASFVSRLIHDPGSQSGMCSTFQYNFNEVLLSDPKRALTKRESLEEQYLLGCHFRDGGSVEGVDD